MILYDDFRSLLPGAQEYDHYMLGSCPFHADSSPSLLVFKDGWFRCLGCSRNGTWKTLWNKLKGQPIQVRPERMSSYNTPNISIGLEEVCSKAHDDLLQFPSFGWYLEMRGLSNSIETCELGYWEGWYTIPVRDRDGKFVGGVFRSAPHIQKATGMRYWSPGSPVLYAPSWFRIGKARTLFVVYGMLDAIALCQMGYPAVTTTGGQHNFNPEWLDFFRGRIVVLPDKDEYKSAMRLSSGLGWRGFVKNLSYPEGIKDPAGFLEANRSVELIKQLEVLW